MHKQQILRHNLQTFWKWVQKNRQPPRRALNCKRCLEFCLSVIILFCFVLLYTVLCELAAAQNKRCRAFDRYRFTHFLSRISP